MPIPLDDFLETEKQICPSQAFKDYDFFKANGLEDVVKVLGRLQHPLLNLLFYPNPILAINNFYKMMAMNIFSFASYRESLGKPAIQNVKEYFAPTEKLEEFVSNYKPDENFTGKLNEIMAKVQLPAEQEDHINSITALAVATESGLKVFETILFNGFFEALPYFEVQAADLPSGDKQQLLEKFKQLMHFEEFEGLVTEEKFKESLKTVDLAERANLFLGREKQYLKNSGLLMAGLYFDIKNLFFGEFTSEAIEKKAKQASSPLFQSFIGGWADHDGLFSLIKEEKAKYINSMGKKIEEGAHLPLAIHLYMINLLKSFFNEHYPVQINLLTNQIKVKEFSDFASANNLKSYVTQIASKNDLGAKINAALERISAEVDDEIALPMFIDLFRDDENRSAQAIERLNKKEFIDLWVTAFKKGWGDQLYQNVNGLGGVLDDNSYLELLTKQDSGSLALLLTDVPFRNYFKLSKLNHNFDLLEQLRELNKSLFDKVYHDLTEQDGPFLSSLVKLVSLDGAYANQLVINEETKDFILSIKDYDPAQVEPILYALTNLKKAQKAVDLGLLPFSGKITDIPDKLVFSQWFFENREMISTELEELEQIATYMGSSKSMVLRQGLVNLFKKQGKNFCDDHLPQFQALGLSPYQRIVGLLSLLRSPKEICRKRDLKNVLMYKAYSTNESEWQKFSSDFLTAGSQKNQEDILESYSAPGGPWLEAMRKSNRFAAAYNQVKGTEQESFLDRIVDLNGKESNQEVIQKIYDYITRGQFKLTELLISQLELGMPAREASKLTDFYHEDHDLEAILPSEITQLYFPQQNIVLPAPRPAPQPGFDYTPFNNYFANQGLNPDIIRTLIEDGFRLNSVGKFIGENYLPCRHVFRNTHNRVDENDAPEFEQTKENIIKLLVAENVVIHHEGKGRSSTNGCVSINPHINEIKEPSLRDYMRHILYE